MTNRLCPVCAELGILYTPHEEDEFKDNLLYLKCLKCETETIMDKEMNPVLVKFITGDIQMFSKEDFGFIPFPAMKNKRIGAAYTILKMLNIIKEES
jgi:hypothetical protein